MQCHYSSNYNTLYNIHSFNKYIEKQTNAGQSYLFVSLLDDRNKRSVLNLLKRNKTKHILPCKNLGLGLDKI